MTANNTQRVNLTLTDREVMRLKRLHNEYEDSDSSIRNLSFTGFCAMLLMDVCILFENGSFEFGTYGNIRRTPGRPKNESLLDAFNKGLRGESDE